MSFRDASASTWILLCVPALVLLGGCDVPSSGPSFETETGLNSPVVVNKTFSFLGGSESQHEPLIDTTTSQFDSLFTVADSDQSIAIEEEVSSFDLGSLDQALDAATEGLGVDASLSEPVIQESGLASQNVSTRLGQTNGVPPPTNPDQTTVPVQSTAFSFPASLLEVPSLDAAQVEADHVKKVTLTDNTSYDGDPVNQITFTLRNEGAGSPDLTDGSGDPPTIRVDDENGAFIDRKSFGSVVEAGTSEQVVVEVPGETLGENAQLELTVAGQDNQDELDIELSSLRYRKALLGGVTAAGVTITESNLSTRAGDARFAGIETRSGTLQLEVANQFRFPIQVDDLRLTNHLMDSALPDSFPDLDISEQSGEIEPGETAQLNVDLAGRGLAEGIDVELDGTLSENRDTLTVAASDSLSVAATGALTVGALYFWPNGEAISTQGQVEFDRDRVSFDRQDDYVELGGGTLALRDLVSESTVGFETVALSFPDIQRAPYDSGDPVDLSFSIEPKTDPADQEVDLSDVRLSPTNNTVSYQLDGTLESIPPSEHTVSTLRVLRYEDEIRTGLTVDGLDVRAVDAGVTPFSVNVTTDANGDGQLDLSDDREASQASFGTFDGLADRTEDLRLTGTELKFHADTDIGTNIQLYAALQGQNGTTRTFLSGTDSEKSVSSVSQSKDFHDGGTQIAPENLIQFGVEGAPKNEAVPRSVALTNENSTVDDFLSTFPTSLRFVAQAHLGGENGRLRLRRPLTFETGLSVAVPVRIKGTFAVTDTTDADFSDLEDVTDPTKDVTVSSAELRVRYTNALPIGADLELFVLDENQTPVLTLPVEGESLRVRPPSTADDGTADGTRTGTATLDLNQAQLRDLAAGRRLALRLTMDQEEGGTATFRATDTIQLSLEASVNASVSVNN